MNTMRILICATFALLVATLVYFYINQNKLNQELTKQLAKSQNHFETQPNFNPNQLPPQPGNTDLLVPPKLTQPTQPKLPDLENPTPQEKLDAEELKTLRDAQLKRLVEEKKKLEEEANTPQIPEINSDRAEMIKGALVMATVDKYRDDLGLAQLTMKYQLTVGQVLSIRRKKTAIAGKLKVAEFVDGKVIADVLPQSFFGDPIVVKPGDELIFIE